MKLVCIADTHWLEDKVNNIPDGDILIHAGDYDIRDLQRLEKINGWFGKLPHKHKICIAGNHDFYLEKLSKFSVKEIFTNVTYLHNDSIEIKGLKIWGSPYTPRFNDWAFMKFSPELKELWRDIPKDSDIVITHGPAYGINDQLRKANGDLGMSVGCNHLRDRLKEIKPRFHICGHIHEAYGVYQDENTSYINCSLVDNFYNLCNEPIVLEV